MTERAARTDGGREEVAISVRALLFLPRQLTKSIRKREQVPVGFDEVRSTGF